MIPKKCKEMVNGEGQWGSFHQHQCTRNVWKDGYCKTHHPETLEVRRKASRKRWKEKVQNSPEMRLQRAYKRIKELEDEVERLKKEIFDLGDHISKEED